MSEGTLRHKMYIRNSPLRVLSDKRVPTRNWQQVSFQHIPVYATSPVSLQNSLRMSYKNAASTKFFLTSTWPTAPTSEVQMLYTYWREKNTIFLRFHVLYLFSVMR